DVEMIDVAKVISPIVHDRAGLDRRMSYHLTEIAVLWLIPISPQDTTKWSVTSTSWANSVDQQWLRKQRFERQVLLPIPIGILVPYFQDGVVCILGRLELKSFVDTSMSYERL